MEAILGVIEDASVDGKRGVATIRFGQRPQIQGIVADIKGGVIRSVSAGYSVQEWRTEKRMDGTRIKTATRWTPKEISFTPLGADPAAKTRNEVNMTEELQRRIRGIATAIGAPAAFADDLIQRNATLEDALTEAARLTPAIDSRAPATITRNVADGLVARLADGLLARMDSTHKPEIGRAFANFSIRDIARETLQHAGLSTLGSPAELITRAQYGAADFPAVLAEVFNKSMLSLRTSPTPLQQIFRRATVADFRARHVLEISDGPTLLKMAEDAQLTYGAISDKELANYSISSFARGFSISFKALVNDDVQALSDLGEKMVRGARGWFSGFLASTIIANPALADTVAVFHANHGNLAAAGAAPGDTTIGAAKLAMRLQTDLAGNVIDAPPRYIVIPASLEGTVDKLLATLYPTSSSTAETQARGLITVVVPQFDKASPAHVAWYLFSDPSVAPVFEFSELSGYEGPLVESRPGFDRLGTEIRVVWHLGAGAIDSRGGYKNPGA